MPAGLVQEAAVEGLDPFLGWDRTPGELVEYILAARERRRRRQEDLAYFAYDLGIHIARSAHGKPERPEMAFRGFIPMREQTDDEICASLMAWANYGEEAE
jgi:hypothetical protein